MAVSVTTEDAGGTGGRCRQDACAPGEADYRRIALSPRRRLKRAAPGRRGLLPGSAQNNHFEAIDV